MEARRAHNPEVVGSSPASATIKNSRFRQKTAVFLTFWRLQKLQTLRLGVYLGFTPVEDSVFPTFWAKMIFEVKQHFGEKVPESCIQNGKILLFDDVHASSAWEVLNEFTEIPVERILLQRVKEDKSFLDIRLSVGVCKEFYQNKIDSFILASSDSDYWGLIPTLEEAQFLVLVEEEKVSGAIRHTLEDAGITYCYLDDFCTGNSNQIKERALLKELRQRLEEEVNFNIREILREVYEVTRADMAAGEKDQFYARYIRPMHIEIDQDGEVYLRLGEK